MPTYTKTLWANGGAPAINAANLGNLETGVFNATDTGVVEVDSYTGTDDAKLTSAMSYAAAQTYKPTLRLSSRAWNFSTQRTLYTGFKITGSGGTSSVEQPRSNNPYATQVNCTIGGTAAWLNVTSDVFGCYVGNLALNGNSTSVFMATNGTGVLWTSVIENVGFANWQHVLGTPAQQLLLTACTFRGFWNVNNSYGEALNIGGSDNTLWTDGCLLDSPTAYTSGGAVSYHLNCVYLAKTYIGPMYITCEGIPAGVRVSGSSSTPGLIFTGLKVEGRNAGAPAFGSVVRVDGGYSTFRDCWFGYGYTAPGSSGRSSEGGLVSVLGGRVIFDGCYVGKATSFAETNPVIYATGSGTKVTVRNMEVGGTWTSLPLVSAVSSATAVVDSSVRTS